MTTSVPTSFWTIFSRTLFIMLAALLVYIAFATVITPPPMVDDGPLKHFE